MGYDALSRRTQLIRPNGITTSYGYDPVSHLQSILHKLGVNTLDGATYGYDLAGNRIRVSCTRQRCIVDPVLRLNPKDTVKVQ